MSIIAWRIATPTSTSAPRDSVCHGVSVPHGGSVCDGGGSSFNGHGLHYSCGNDRDSHIEDSIDSVREYLIDHRIEYHMGKVAIHLAA